MKEKLRTNSDEFLLGITSTSENKGHASSKYVGLSIGKSSIFTHADDSRENVWFYLLYLHVFFFRTISRKPMQLGSQNLT